MRERKREFGAFGSAAAVFVFATLRLWHLIGSDFNAVQVTQHNIREMRLIAL